MFVCVFLDGILVTRIRIIVSQRVIVVGIIPGDNHRIGTLLQSRYVDHGRNHESDQCDYQQSNNTSYPRPRSWFRDISSRRNVRRRLISRWSRRPSYLSYLVVDIKRNERCSIVYAVDQVLICKSLIASRTTFHFQKLLTKQGLL